MRKYHLCQINDASPISSMREGRAVARNIFLDGNTFQDSRSVDKEPLDTRN